MFKPHHDAERLTLFAAADDGGSGPTQTYADFLPGAAESYVVPTGCTLHIQRVGVSLDRPATGESAWGVLKPGLYNETTWTMLASEIYENAIYPPDVVVDTWCFFDVFEEVPSGHVLRPVLDNPNDTRGRARFVIRGWLVPDSE